MDSTKPLVSTFQEWMHVIMHRSMRSFILFTKENGLSMSQMGALFQINHRQACGVSDIADELGVTSAAASQLIDRLVQQGLILRTEDPNDRRLKQIVLAEKGRRLLEEGTRVRESWMVELVERLSPEEQDRVGEVLKLLTEKARSLESADEGAGLP